MKPCLILCAFALMTISCNNKVKTPSSPTPAKVSAKTPAKVNTDTLQFIHFEDNYDYWYAEFLDSKMDTIQLVSDSILNDTLKNKMFRVQWTIDTLTEAGDNESKYAAKRLLSFKIIEK